MRNIAIIFAGGVGERMGGSIPKQFLNISGKPILIHTLEKFQYNENIDKIYLACNKEWISEAKKLIQKFNITKLNEKSIVLGGSTGQDSIFNALELAYLESEKENIVLIHDGVRPIIDDQIINENIERVKQYGCSVTCSDVYETPIHSKTGTTIDNTLIRSEVYLAKAPQCFILEDIYNVHLEERKKNIKYEGIVDSCNLMLKYGRKPSIVLCGQSNIKVTTPDDYIDLVARFSSEDYRTWFLQNS